MADPLNRLRELLGAATGPTAAERHNVDCICVRCESTRDLLRALPALLDELDVSRAMLKKLPFTRKGMCITCHRATDGVSGHGVDCPRPAYDAALARLGEPHE